MILGFKEIVQAINNGEITLKRYTAKPTITESVISSNEFSGKNKIPLHVGFLIKTLSTKRWIDPKATFANIDGIVDLRETEKNTYIISPGESIVLYSNEFISLSCNYFGFLLPKVSNGGTYGITIIPSYVDSYWQGVVQLMVTNHSGESKEISLGHEIANLIIAKHETHEYTPKENVGSHYGLDWINLFNDPINKICWNPRSRGNWIKFQHWFQTRRKIFAPIAILSIVTGIITGIYYLIQLIDYIRP